VPAVVADEAAQAEQVAARGGADAEPHAAAAAAASTAAAASSSVGGSGGASSPLARAIATMLYVAPDAEARLDEARTVLAVDDSAPVEWGASAWNGLLCIRGVSPEASALRRQTAQFLNRFRSSPLPRVWQC
jgi:urease accessory protein UreH